MVFRNLPVEFDERGRPVLREPADTAYVTDGKDTGGWPGALPPEEVRRLAAESRFIKAFSIPSIADSDEMTEVAVEPLGPVAS
ncbi:MAG TPA: hypothetical protein VFO60_09600 [Candidatus Dormibacteraeota bacterium]|nr:hypothetical protein [Candidatus Dormibacteraeota bacterium]